MCKLLTLPLDPWLPPTYEYLLCPWIHGHLRYVWMLPVPSDPGTSYAWILTVSPSYAWIQYPPPTYEYLLYPPPTYEYLLCPPLPMLNIGPAVTICPGARVKLGSAGQVMQRFELGTVQCSSVGLMGAQTTATELISYIQWTFTNLKSLGLNLIFCASKWPWKW